MLPILIDKKNERRYDDCLKYTIVASKSALADAGLAKGSEEFEKLNKTRVGVLVGTGMGGLQVFQDGVENLVQKVRIVESVETCVGEDQFVLCGNMQHRTPLMDVLRVRGYRGTARCRRSSSRTPSQTWEGRWLLLTVDSWGPTIQSPQPVPQPTTASSQHSTTSVTGMPTLCWPEGPRHPSSQLAWEASLPAGELSQ